MILTPIPPEQLAGTLDRFMAGLSDRFSRTMFRRIRTTSPERAVSGEAERHRRDAAGGEADESEHAIGHDGARTHLHQRPFRMGAADGALVERAFACERRRKRDGAEWSPTRGSC